MVSADGKLEHCQALEISSHRELAPKICRLLEDSAVMRSGKDRNGTRIYGVISPTMIFLSETEGEREMRGQIVYRSTANVDLTVAKLPKGSSRSPVARLAVVVSASGEIESCDVVQKTGSPALDQVACSRGPTREQMEVVKDDNGVLIRSVQGNPLASNQLSPQAGQRESGP